MKPDSFFVYLGKSKTRTHIVALALSTLALMILFAFGGPTPFKLGLSLSIWLLIDGFLVAFATAYSEPDAGEFRGADAVIGMVMTVSSAVFLAGAGLYSWIGG